MSGSPEVSTTVPEAVTMFCAMADSGIISTTSIKLQKIVFLMLSMFLISVIGCKHKKHSPAYVFPVSAKLRSIPVVQAIIGLVVPTFR